MLNQKHKVNTQSTNEADAWNSFLEERNFEVITVKSTSIDTFRIDNEKTSMKASRAAWALKAPKRANEISLWGKQNLLRLLKA